MFSLLVVGAAVVSVVDASFRMTIEPVELSNRDTNIVQGDGYGLKLHNFGDIEYYGRLF